MDSRTRIARSPVVDVTVLFVALITVYWLSRNAQSELFLMPTYLVLVFISLLDSLFLGFLGRADFQVVLAASLLLLSVIIGVLTHRIRT